MSKPYPTWYETTKTATPEQKAEFAKVEAEVERLSAIHAKIEKPAQAAQHRMYDLFNQYQKKPTAKTGAALLKATAKFGFLDQKRKVAYTALNEACAVSLALKDKLLKDKALRPSKHSIERRKRMQKAVKEHPTAEIAYLQGWTNGEPYSENARGGVVIGWGKAGCGFGTMTFYQTKDGKGIEVETECMGPKFVKEVLAALLKQAKIVE